MADRYDERIFDVAPGEKVEDNRSRLAVFMAVLGRKFWKLMGINLMYMLFNLPAIVLSFFLGLWMMQLFMPNVVEGTSVDVWTILLVSVLPSTLFLMVVPSLSFGPAQAGLAYLMRCYAYELPVFVWSDFKEKVKENFRQGLIVSLIHFVLLIFLLIDLYLYSKLSFSSSIIMPIANGLMIIVFLLYLMMSLYLYPMMVTYNLKIKDLYKNAFIFAFAKFIPNLAVLAISFILILGPILLVQLTANMIALAITYTFYLVFSFSLPGLVSSFFINPILDKHLKRID